MRYLAAALASLTSISAAGCSFSSWDHATARREIIQSAEHVSGSALTIQTHNGGLEVLGSPDQSDVQIHATLVLRAATEPEAQRRAAEASLKVERDAKGRLHITPVFPEPRHGGDGASIRVTLPDATNVTLEASNGPITVRGLGGLLMADTSNGPIDVSDHNGPAQIETSNGPVSVSNITGKLVVDTSNGPLDLENINGSVIADTSNGSITLSLLPEQRGPLHLDTSNGPIKVRVGSAFAGPVHLDTSNSRVTVNDPQKRVTENSLGKTGGSIVVGDGGEASRVDTSNASIVFTISG
jgi:hypothetical protein